MPPPFVTREELRDEFRFLARKTLAEEVRELGNALRSDVQHELRRCLATSVSARNVNADEVNIAGTACFDTELAVAKYPHFFQDPLHGMMVPMSPASADAPVMHVREEEHGRQLRLAGNGVHPCTSLLSSVDGKECFVPSGSPKISADTITADGGTVQDQMKPAAVYVTSMYERPSSREAWSTSPRADAWPPLVEDLDAAQDEKAPTLKRKVTFSKNGDTSEDEASNNETALKRQISKNSSCASSGENWKRIASKDSATEAADAAEADKARRGWGRQKTVFRTTIAEKRRSTILSTAEGSNVMRKYRLGGMSNGEFFAAWLRSDHFDYIMGFFLITNAISIGAQADNMASIADTGPKHADVIPQGFRIIDGLFCFVFVFELTARLAVDRWQWFVCKTRYWNYFDAVVVSFQVIDELTKLFLEGSALQKTIDNMGVLRMLRLARIIRLVRMVRLLPQLKSMVYLISASMEAFLWTIALLFILIYCLSVYYTELCTDVVRKKSVSEESEEVLRNNFGSIGHSILSLFQAITGGDDWRNFVDDFVELGHRSMMVNTMVFAVYIAFASLVMLNLVTGVFVEGAQRLIQEEKDGELLKSVNNLFKLTDSDLSGSISAEEFEACMVQTEEVGCGFLSDFHPGEAKNLFKMLDVDHSGQIDVDEFVAGLMRLRGNARSIDLTALKNDFHEVTETWGDHFLCMEKDIQDIQESVRCLVTSLKGSGPSWNGQFAEPLLNELPQSPHFIDEGDLV
jgi:hypothetical protein